MSNDEEVKRKVGHGRKRLADSQMNELKADKIRKMTTTDLPSSDQKHSNLHKKSVSQCLPGHAVDRRKGVDPPFSSSLTTDTQSWFCNSFSRNATVESVYNPGSDKTGGEPHKCNSDVTSDNSWSWRGESTLNEKGNPCPSHTVLDRRLKTVKVIDTGNLYSKRPFSNKSTRNKPDPEDSGMDLLDESLKDDDLLKEIEEMEELVVSNDEKTSRKYFKEKGNSVSKTKTDKILTADKIAMTAPTSYKKSTDHSIQEFSEKQKNRSTNLSQSSVQAQCNNQTKVQCQSSEEIDKDFLSDCLFECDDINSLLTITNNCSNTSTPKSKPRPSRQSLPGDRIIQRPSASATETSENKLKGHETMPVSTIANNTPIHSNVSTPKSHSGVLGHDSLSARIKQRLQANAAVSPQCRSAMTDQVRINHLQQAHADAARIQKEGTEVDIGPFYGLPSKVQQLLESNRGIKKLYDWQDACLRLPAVMEGKNLIYSLPTSGGKTLVAEILILRELLCKKRDAMLILPFVSIVQEKVRIMSVFAVELDFLVEEYAGSKGRFPPLKRRKKQSLYIATIEKSHALVNSLIEGGRLDSIGLVVVDELHMLGDGGSRGATLETTLVKLLYAAEKVQVIGMSATLNNIDDLKVFLEAEVYTDNFRPVKLTEYIKLEDTIYRVDNSVLCPEDRLQHERVVTFKYSVDMTKADPDHLLGLVLEVIPANSCLLFCPTKKNCENVAKMLCKLLVKYRRDLSDVKKKERKELLYELYNDGNGKMCPVLQYTIHFGVAYHHSGLTMDERRLIEDAYADGTLCLLACTSTLAAGVNLPAKRVILRNCNVGSDFISRSQYKQMVGRAGRAGIDSSGESILIMNKQDKKKVMELISGQIESCHSSLLYDSEKGIRSLLLTTVGLKVTPTTEDVFMFCQRTLLSVQSKSLQCDIAEITKKSLETLIDVGLIVQKSVVDNSGESKCSLEVTHLGRATFKGSVDIEQANQLYTDLCKAKESLVLSSYLHLLYLVTPYEAVRDIRPMWTVYFTQMNFLDPENLKVAILIGVPEVYIAKKASGQVTKQKVNEFAVNRFYLTLILYDLWQQKTLWEVSEKYQLPRGFIQSLLSSSASFASCVLRFCEELEEFWAFQQLLGDFVKRLTYCVTAELIPLMEIPGVKLGRAKQLYQAGCKSLAMVANVDPDFLVSSIKQISKKVAKQIVISAKALLNEKTEALLEEVEDMVTIPNNILTQSILTPAVLSSLISVTPDYTDSQDSQTV